MSIDRKILQDLASKLAADIGSRVADTKEQIELMPSHEEADTIVLYRLVATSMIVAILLHRHFYERPIEPEQLEPVVGNIMTQLHDRVIEGVRYTLEQLHARQK